MRSNILSEVSACILFWLKSQTPPSLTFHTINHTLDVVNGVKEIGLNSRLSDKEMEAVELAAWFHDIGYLTVYTGHEEESVRVAREFLSEKAYPAKGIEQVAGCILATKMPQSPKNILEKVLCDADLYHLSFPDFWARGFLLRTEWEIYLNKHFSEEEWDRASRKFLSSHKYFTNYGQSVLQDLKEKNLEKLKLNS